MYVYKLSKRGKKGHVIYLAFLGVSAALKTLKSRGAHLAHLEKKSGTFLRVILDIFSTFAADIITLSPQISLFSI